MLKKYFPILIIFICLNDAYASKNITCDQFLNSTKTQRIISEVNSLSHNFIWEGYAPSNNPLVLTDLKTNPDCVAVYDGDTWSLHQLSSSLIVENGVYEFYPYSEENPELINILKTKKIERALVFSLHDILNYFPEFPGGEFSLSYYVLIHEGFHLFAQLGSTHWPAWVNEEEYNDRDALVDRCYNSNVNNVRNELKELIHAFKNRKNVNEFNKSIMNFIGMREKRYAEYPLCKDFEASWELTEGVAEYVGWSGSLINFVKIDGYIAFLETVYERTQNEENVEYFYNLGALQLFVINELSPSLLYKNNPFLGEERTAEDSIFNIIKKLLVNRKYN